MSSSLGVGAFWCAQEWLIHDKLLHAEAAWLDPVVAIHRNHHELPYFHTSIDAPALAWAFFGAAALLCALGALGATLAGLAPAPLAGARALAALASYTAMGLRARQRGGTAMQRGVRCWPTSCAKGACPTRRMPQTSYIRYCARSDSRQTHPLSLSASHAC